MSIRARQKGKPQECEVCTLGKMINTRNRDPDARAEAPLELVHTDLAGPITPTSREGYSYALAFTDDFSGATFAYFLKNKSDTLTATKIFLADVTSYGSVKRIRSDNGTEFSNGQFKSLLIENKIKHEFSAPYSPHQNGTAERHWRTLFEMARCLLIQAKLDKVFWPYAVMTASYIRNRCFNERIQQTPFQALTKKRPNLANMAFFGSECFAYSQKKTKIGPRCEKGVFLGYDKESPAYIVYFPRDDKIARVRNVKFSNKIRNETAELSLSENEESDEFIPRKIRSEEENHLMQPQNEGVDPPQVLNQPGPAEENTQAR